MKPQGRTENRPPFLQSAGTEPEPCEEVGRSVQAARKGPQRKAIDPQGGPERAVFAQSPSPGGIEPHHFPSAIPALRAVQKMGDVAGQEKKAQFQQEASFGTPAAGGQVIEEGAKDPEEFAVPVGFAENLLRQFAAVGGQSERDQIGAQSGTKIDQLGLTEGHHGAVPGRRPMDANGGKGLECGTEPLPALARAAGVSLHQSELRREKGDDPIGFAVVEMAEDDGVGAKRFHGHLNASG